MKLENKKALLMYVAAALIAGAGYFLLPLLAEGRDLSLQEYYVLNAVQQVFLFIVPGLMILRANALRWQRFKNQLRPLSSETTGYCMLLAVASTVIVSLVIALWLPVVEGVLGYIPEDTPLPKPESAAQWMIAILCIAVVPGIAEEIFFRAFLQTAISKFLPRGAVWITAAVFAALHFDFAGLPGLLLMGWMLGKILQRRGVLAGMLFHALYNAAVLLLNYKQAQISSLAVMLCTFAFFFSVRRLMREEEKDAVDGTGM